MNSFRSRSFSFLFFFFTKYLGGRVAAVQVPNYHLHVCAIRKRGRGKKESYFLAEESFKTLWERKVTPLSSPYSQWAGVEVLKSV